MNEEYLMKLIEDEGDYKSFYYRGLFCEIKRISKYRMGHLCGYVHIPSSNKYANANEDTVNKLDVHGGITYHGDNVIGFDCAHSGDLIPMNVFNFTDLTVGGETYKTMDYVTNELYKLVDQILFPN